ncbi:unnamed protein product [Spirodela intermedia]|uniref:Uncharacterized protein n=1 Tax=Spirodela intermedia TaxID=51605 RepID=A0A7I8IQZ4_SPIIN|nr:unnamed protein product [Spirodela intermedia]CAA6660281.1 unnamed protein product [Spirodela intermedia]
MFYSQFILARKGPLGTIWIAAHLERKLRKNQVADTDIGESVDSILFPDVPIALRLSSHLLLGVVRIYSRKVNYLFHDCSETLLRVKQAFRSTAVDLPPEESTAPYHSITLPETFDLDDFELPDSALLNGNFVDHHISTREQITLQDTVDATGYSISQFGLDERFGDGDASQIGLDLDEDIVLDKGSSIPDNLLGSEEYVSPASQQFMEHKISLQHEEPFPSMDIDNDYDEEHNAGTSKNIGEDSAIHFGRRIPRKLQDMSEEGPSLLSHCEHIERSPSVPDDTIVSFRIHQTLPDTIENAQTPSTPALIQEAIPANVQNIALSPSGKASPSNDAEAVVVNPSRSHMESECHDSDESGDLVKDKHESCLNQANIASKGGNSELSLKEPVLGESEFLDGVEQSHADGLSIEVQEVGNVVSQQGTDCSKDEDLGDVISKGSRIEINCSASSEYPEPERMLLGTRGIKKGVTESDGSVDRGVSTRGRKRHLTESSPFQLNGILAKSSRASQSGRNAEYIPDDDDVLASILVGRSSALKLKSTPTLSTMPPSKRQRQASRAGLPKRKMLLDDTMVLHADAIREQLISTEDIRRTRRKAPCTRPEIWVIQKCLIEEGIFCEPVLTGMPLELVILHSQTFDLNDAPDSGFNTDYSHLELPKIQNNSDFSEKSKVNETESNPKAAAKDDGEKEEISDVLEISQTTPSSLADVVLGDANNRAQSASLTAPHLVEATAETSSSNKGDDDMNTTNLGVIAPEGDYSSCQTHCDFCSAVGGNDTGFLNVDDEVDFDEEVENELPDTEEAQSTENSGWSSRTKGVARFLRSLFDEETGRGRTAVAVDQLLAGKTRKEASRMFFETLVLSTKDYILVDQENSFKNISIKPRSKLLKSDF